MSTITPLKLAYADDIRKIRVENLTIASLSDNIRTLFSDLQSVPFEDLFIYYIDDENDKIRIKLDLELTEAMRLAQPKQSVLKIFVQKLGDTSLGSSTNTPTPALNVGVSELAPFFGMLNNVAPMLLNNPAAIQQMASMLPSMLPLLSSFLNPAQTPTSDPTNSSLPPFVPIVSSPTTSDCGLNATPTCSSTSTNTSVDARDVATETYLYGVAQTTQTQHSPNAHQTTQTNHNMSSATQTAQEASATQMTQTSQNATCATQTNQNATCATQTAQELLASHTTQTQSAQATCETQTPCEPQSPVNFYDSLAGTLFGGLLEQLRELGFTDREKCVQALVKNGGKLPEAIDELLLDQLLE